MRLPSTASLLAFVEAARTESFAAAAQTLALTPAAVSKQVARLEETLGIILFKRGQRSVHLTDVGRDLLPRAEAALAALSSTVHGAALPAAPREMVIDVDLEFLRFWLMERLPFLQDALDGAMLRFVPTMTEAHRPDPRSDLAIVFGRPLQPGLVVEELLAATVFPVTCPDYAATHRDVESSTLLHDMDTSWWDDFATGTSGARRAQGEIVLGRPIVALEAAEKGLGVAIGDDVVCRAALQAGRLICPFDLERPSRKSFFLVTHAGRRRSETVTAAIEWFRAAADEHRQWRATIETFSDYRPR